jgi:Protein of unknown function (DUF3097)
VTPDFPGFDRYGSDVLATGRRDARPARPKPAEVRVEKGLVLEEEYSGFVGAVVRNGSGQVELEDRRGKIRVFPLDSHFLIDGQRVVLKLAPAAPAGRARTASGSFAAPEAKARVARASRILVEGRHDAELVEKVWGADLRVEGVVVEYLSGLDNLEAVLADLRPSAERRIGVLADHLVPGSKESRIAEAIARGPHGRHVLVVGHPYVDVWQSVKPSRLGLKAWPVIPRSMEWKVGICKALGWPHADKADIGMAWQRILGTVRTFADLEPELLGRVEELIDFVTTE